MKSAKMVKFQNLPKETQDHLNELRRKADYATRDKVIKLFGIGTANDCWYTKKEYIENDTYAPDFLLFVCPVCGTAERDWTCISDKAGACQSRDVVSRCKCGEVLCFNA